MSLFRTIQTPCPSCGVPVSFDLVHSVNADRRPALRTEIMDRTFQRQTCPSCGDTFRLEPEFTYLHIGGKQFLSVWPASSLPHWAECEQRSLQAFNRFYGTEASPAAAALGRELSVRMAFGWEAAHEKLVVRAAGIDDHTLELAKISILRTVDGIPAGADRELRLLGIDADDNMVLGLFTTGSETLEEELVVPKALLGEIEAEPDAWQPLRDLLSAGPFVDVARLTIEPTPSVAA